MLASKVAPRTAFRSCCIIKGVLLALRVLPVSRLPQRWAGLSYPSPIIGWHPPLLCLQRLNGYYGVSQFTVSNTMASLPFIFLISVVSGGGLAVLATLMFKV